jgi:hypothetical protein
MLKTAEFSAIPWTDSRTSDETLCTTANDNNPRPCPTQESGGEIFERLLSYAIILDWMIAPQYNPHEACSALTGGLTTFFYFLNY